MPELKILQGSENRLPVTLQAPDAGSTGANKQTKILRALVVFAPLATEVVYGLTGKWLAKTNISGVVSRKLKDSEATNARCEVYLTHISRKAKSNY